MKSEHGFTLIEMMVVVSVLGALSAVVISVINTQAHRQRAQDAVNIAQLEQVSQAIESYQAFHGSYPSVSGTIPNYAADPDLAGYIAAAKWPSGLAYVTNGTNFAAFFAAGDGHSYYTYGSSYGEVRHCGVAATSADPTLCSEL
jgi:prepilin-type N-terminal cleavage/methylation domain-containing protein